MFKTILVPAFSDDSDRATYAAALAVARPFGAHLDMLHVRLDPADVALAMSTDAGSGALTAGLIDKLEDDARDREVKAHTIFATFCEENALALTDTPAGGGDATPSAQWHVETGEGMRWVTAYGTTSDLIVVGRADGVDVSARSVVETVLLETGRPLLIPAASPMPASVGRVAIAWKRTAQAARAVTMAMPLLCRAKEITVMTVAEEPDEHPEEGDRLLRNLAWRGLTARKKRLAAGPEGAAATLLAAASNQADLLVMGGYSHNRLKEWVFGGFTQQVLAAAPLPVLIAH